MSETLLDTGRLAALETTIERGLATFADVGLALLELRDGRLYRTTHGTFDDYCRERWQMTSRRALQLIEAAAVVTQIGTIVPISATGPSEQSEAPAVNRNISTIVEKPVTESVAREVAKAGDAEAQRDAWSEAVQTAPRNAAGKPQITAKVVQQVVAKRKSATSTPYAGEQQQPWSAWAAEVQLHLQTIDGAARLVTRLIGAEKEGGAKSPYAYFMHSNDSTTGLIREGLKNIRDALPAAASDKQPGFIPQREAKMRQCIATSNVSAADVGQSATPWDAYNEQRAELIADIEHLRSRFSSLTADGPFAAWIDGKAYDKFFKDTVAHLTGHEVIGWATTAQTRAAPDGRNFLYLYETYKNAVLEAPHNFGTGETT